MAARKQPCIHCGEKIFARNMPRHVECKHPDAVEGHEPGLQEGEPADVSRADPVAAFGEEAVAAADRVVVETVTIEAGPLPDPVLPDDMAPGGAVLTIPIVEAPMAAGSENGEGLAAEPVEGPVEEPPLPSYPGRSEPLPDGPLVILVTSGKGGVGKSTVSLGLAQGLHQATGAQVGVIDADIDNPCLQVLGGAEIPDLLETSLSAREVNGVRVYSPGAAMSPGVPFMREERDRLDLLASMRSNLDWSDCRYLIIDTPPGASTEVRGLVAAEHPAGAIIVTQPSRVSFEAIRRTHTMLKMLQVEILGVVENMSGGALGNGAGDLAHDILGVSLLARIGLDAEIARRGDLGEPMPLAPFAHLIHKVLEWEDQREEFPQDGGIA